MSKAALHFTLLIGLILGVSFVIHSSIQHYTHIGSFEFHLILNYLFNFVITCGVTMLLIFFDSRTTNKLGFVFLYSSMFKFLLFFIFIKPNLALSEGSKEMEFMSFFIPYGICLVTETIYLVRLLGKRY